MRLNYITYLFISIGFILGACSDSEEETEQLVAKGNKMYGGELKFMSTEKIDNLYPTFVADVYSTRLISQIYEPLLVVDPVSGKVNEAVAESFSLSDDKRVYTFKIRKGIYFHKDPCFKEEKRELTAKDVKFSLDMACTNHKKNEIYYLLVDRVEGARKHYESTSNGKMKSGGVSGIKVIDKFTVQVTLTEPFVGFEKVLTHYSLGITAPEAFKKYGNNVGKHPVGTGPFALESMSSSKIVLKRNPNYWRKDEFGNQLPFLSKVVMTYAKNKKSELMAFRNSKIDIVLELPVEETEHILGTLKEAQEGKNVKHKVDAEKSMSMMFIAMANQSEEFSDERVRMAFNLAIDRNVIVDQHLEGEGWPAKHGFVPEMKDYPLESVKGYEFNPEKARQLLSQAGYSNGKGFPELDFYVNAIKGSGVHRACQAIAEMIKENLNITLNIKLCTLEERRQAIDSGAAKIWRGGWIADYPDPENFLTMFYGANIRNQVTMVNAFKFDNEEFNALYEKALVETDPVERMKLLSKCDQIVVDHAPVMPIMTDDHIVMINARVRDFNATPMENLNLTNVYIKEPRKKEE